MTKTAKRSNNTRRREYDTTPLANFLSSLRMAVKPSFHVNGSQFMSAVVTVDLGEPLKPSKLTSEQHQELVTHMRTLTRDITGRDGTISVNTDHHRGIYWANANG